MITKNKIQRKTVKFLATDTYDLSVTFPFYDRTVDDMIEKAVGRRSDGSGFGMGSRDMHWGFLNKADADRAAAKVKNLKKKGVKVSLREEDEDCLSETSHSFQVSFDGKKATVKQV